jgi:hypothetical protein
MTDPRDPLVQRLRDGWRRLGTVEPPTSLYEELGRRIREPSQARRSQPVGRGVVALAAAAALIMLAAGLLLVGSLTSPGPTPAPTGTPRPWGPEPTHDTRYVGPVGIFFRDDPVSFHGRQLRISFQGAPSDPSDPCSVDYTASTTIADGVLNVGVVPTYPAGTTPAPSCDLTNQRGLDVNLDAPFTGFAWRDLYGPYLFFTDHPPGLVELTGLPPGWEQGDGGNVGASAGGSWGRGYSPDFSDPSRGLTFIQAFGGPVLEAVSSASESQHVKVGDADAQLYRHLITSPTDPRSPASYLTLVWRLGDDGLALIANEQDFTVDALIDLAESAKAP